MKLINRTELVAAIVGLVYAIGSASNESITTSTLLLASISALVLIKMQIERANKV